MSPRNPERLVLDVCRAIARAHGDRRLQWSNVDQVAAQLSSVTTEQLEAALAVAVKRGWIETAGRPAHSVILKAEGRAAIGAAR